MKGVLVFSENKNLFTSDEISSKQNKSEFPAE